MKTPFHILSAVRFAALLTLSAWIAGARGATTVGAAETDEYAQPRVSDPFEPVNRACFKFNDGFYMHLLRPFARGYQRVMPAPARRGIGNFFDNLKFPVRFVGSVLQGKPGRATRETGKFLLNSTVGVAGLMRVSDSVPALATVPPEDIGQAFGSWGIGAGPYLVLPIMGPSSVRDAIGLTGATLLNPVNRSATENAVQGYDSTWRFSLQTLDSANESPDLIRTYDSFKQFAVDPYLSVRSGYLQHRAAAIKK